MAPNFVIGQVYNRRTDIHLPYGGQRQSGIVTPSKFPFIFIFTGRGKRHGYNDEFFPDGRVRYFGEGQKGDMTLTKGNKAIANHAANGKDLLLFEMLGKRGVQFCGIFNCAGFEEEPGKSQFDKNRKAIVFYLEPIGGVTEETTTPKAPAQVSLNDLRKRALAAAGPARSGTLETSTRLNRLRSEAVRQYVLARAAGICECCKKSAPFKTGAGAAYLEPHHIRRLGDGGPDDPRHVAGICPNCHREIHYGINGNILNSTLQAFVTSRESKLSD